MTSKWLMIPKTHFNPRFHATSRELELISQVQKFTQNVDSKTFSIRESPLSVHGQLHFGHFYNKVHKDILKRYKLLRGYQITPSMQFELFGPQIEHEAFQQLLEQGISTLAYDEKKIRQICSNYAQNQLQQYIKSITRWGLLEQEIGLTIDPRYQKQILYLFADFLEANKIKKDHKIVVWSKSRFSEVPLDSVLITQSDTPGNALKLKFITQPKQFQQLKCDFYLITEIASPWKLPTAKAIQLQDQELLVMKNQEALIMTKEFYKSHKEEFQTHQYIGSVQSTELQAFSVDNGLEDFQKLQIIIGEENNIVCPAHQMEDIPYSKRYNLSRIGQVNENGQLLYNDKEYDILSNQANNIILQELRSNNRILDVVSSTQEVFYYHKVTGEQLILRSVPAWFVEYNKQEIQHYQNNHKSPQQNENNGNDIYTSYQELMEGLHGQWCISDQNVWGIPIPLFYATQPKKIKNLKHGYLLNSEICRYFADLVEQNGSDIFWTWNITDLLPEKYRHHAQYLERHTCILNKSFMPPKCCDLIYEGVDQNESFMFASQMMALITKTQGFKYFKLHPVLQTNKDKMSKNNCFNLQNVIDGQIKANNEKQYGSGVDILRALVTVIDPEEELNQIILDKKKEQINYIRKLYWQILGCLENAQIIPVDIKELKFIDSYIYQQLLLFIENITTAYEQYNFGLVYELYIDFMQNYVQPYISNTRGKIIAFNSQYQNSLYIYFKIYDFTISVISPILCFNAYDIHPKLPNIWPKVPVSHLQQAKENLIQLSLLHKIRKSISLQIDEIQQRIKQKSIHKKLEIVLIVQPNSYEMQLLDQPLDQLALFFGCGEVKFESEMINKKRPNHLCKSSFFIRESFYHEKINFHVKIYELKYEECPRCLEHKHKVGEVCTDCTTYVEIEEQKLKQLE